MASDPTPSPDQRLAVMDLDQKIALLDGADMWHTRGVAEHDIPVIKVTDGPNGARGDSVLGTGDQTSACLPCGSALGATWDPVLLERLGSMLGVECESKAAHVLLAPTVNIHRSPLGGRNFECYSEDPELSGRIAVGFIRGVQSEGVATTVKHFVGNDSEFERNTIDSIIDERTLREVYLRPFELAVKEGDAWGLMCAYNRLNGVHCSENHRLLTEILRDEWGFDGFVVSDWFALKSTAASANAGLDLEMPGPGAWYGDKLRAAVEAGEVPEAQLDLLAGRMLRLMDRVDAFTEPKRWPETSDDRPEHRALCKEAAIAGTVLLKNDDGLLPLDPAELRRVAVIGPNAAVAQIMGGGSAGLRAHYYQTPLDAITEHLGPDVEVVHEPGCVTTKTIPTIGKRHLRTLDGEPGMHVEFFNDHDLGGEVVAQQTVGNSRLMFFGTLVDGVDPSGFSFRATGRYVPDSTGDHTFSLIEVGRARLKIDGQTVIDGWTEVPERGESFFHLGSVELTAAVALTAGEPVDIVIEYSSRDAMLLYAANVGCQPPIPVDIIDRAAAAAADADVAIVVVGTNDDWETEGNDRESMDLPGDQAELIRRVAAAQDNTAVVINAGSVIDVGWADDVPAILDVWFGGQGMAEGLADVVFGAADPGGRLPTTFPRRLEDTPAFTSYPGENGAVRYGEGLFVGYRWYDSRAIDPAFCFGHGLSYADFSYGDPTVPETAVAGAPIRMQIPITNVGDRDGVEVVQVYAHAEAPRLARPDQELKGFAKVAIGAGETVVVDIDLDERAFAYFDPGLVEGHRAALLSNQLGDWRTDEPGWTVDPGVYELRIGSSSRDIRAVAVLNLT